METIIQSVNNLVSVRFKLSQRNYFIKRIAKNFNSFFKIPNTKKKAFRKSFIREVIENIPGRGSIQKKFWARATNIYNNLWLNIRRLYDSENAIALSYLKNKVGLGHSYNIITLGHKQM